MRAAGRRRSWNAPFVTDLGRAEIGQEILAGVMGWQTVVTSLEFYASLFVSDDDSDKVATAEIFMLVAGVSTIAFGLATNLPFIVAPSVLYAGRQTGITLGGQLAAQALANAAAALVFWFALKLKLVSYIPTALRIGAGYGVAMLVGVLGMRNVGLLEANAFVLSAFTWESSRQCDTWIPNADGVFFNTVVGLAVITAASTTTPPRLAVKKWVYVLGVPTIVTLAMYAVIDLSKFQGYASADNYPLSNWRGGSFGLVDFPAIFDDPGQYTFYVVRTFISIVINIMSVLLVLIDTVCLQAMTPTTTCFLRHVHYDCQRFRGVVKSAEDTDYSDAIGGTNKFRRMACAIPMMSFIGNLLGVTTQAAFVQSMIVVFAGGKTGLSAVVTGSLFVLSTVIWPLLPVIVPAHISGALTIVITLRFFTAIRVIDVAHAENLLMFGVSILLIPFSFDFVDALCVAIVLGFICTVSNKVISRGVLRKSSKVSVSISVRSKAPDKAPETNLPNDTRRVTSSSIISRTNVLSPIGDGTTMSTIGSDHFPPMSPLPLRTPGLRDASKRMIRHKSLPSMPVTWTPTSGFLEEEEGEQFDAEKGKKRQPFCHIRDQLPRQNQRQPPRSHTKDLAQSEVSAETSHCDRSSFSSTLNSISSGSSSRRSMLGRLRRVKVGTRSRRIHTESTTKIRKHGLETPDETESANGQTVHWKLALVAAVQLVLKVVSDERQK